MRRGWILTVAVWLAAAVPVKPEENPARYASVSGVVLNDSTGSPVRRAQVTLTTLDPAPLEAVTFSEPDGAFGFHSIPPGKYRLYVHMDGYREAWFGAATPNRPRAILNLAAGDNRYGITFRLRPLGAISGVVLDLEGDPVVNAQIRLLKSGWDHLQPAYKTDAWASTDDRGRYRFPGLPPGQYIAMAASYYAPALAVEPSAAANSIPSQKMYGAAFYPDTSRLSAATPIQVEGKEIDGIDFHLAVRVAATLRGKILVPADFPPNTNVLIGIFPQDVPEGGDQSVAANAPAPQYEFEIGNLVPGPYVLVASASAASGEYWAVEKIELPPGGQEITVQAERGTELAGRVEVEGNEPSPHAFRVSLLPSGYPPGRHEVQAETQPDGAFALSGVTPGNWDINVKPVPAGGFVKSIRLGDRDVASGSLTIETGMHGPLRVVMSTRGAVVRGTVVIPPGVARIARAAVLLAPGGERAGELSLYALGTADDAGHFEFTGVTPGRYRIYAFEELDRAAYEDPGFLKPFEKLCEAFDVPEGGRVERQTQLILTGTGARE